MKNNLQLVEYCKAQLGKPYIYGTFGQILTEKLLNEKAKQYPKYLSASRVKTAKANYLGQRVHDCYGLYKGFLWSDTADSAPKYKASEDLSADGAFNKATEKGTIDTLPNIVGLAVRYKGHVGVYIGNGEVIEARGFDYGVVKTKLSARKWTHWYKFSEIEYKAEATPAPAPAPAEKKEEKGANTVTIELEVLRKGSKGAQVATLQRLLSALGYRGRNGLKLDIDKSFGANTEYAVRSYQSNKGLQVDGVVGAKTWASLLK